MYICVHTRDVGCPWSWNYRKFRATQHGYWGLNSMVLYKNSPHLTSKPFLQPHLPFVSETGLTIFKAGLLCSPGRLICLCFLSAVINGVPHHNGSSNCFANDHPFSHSLQYNITLPNYIFFSLNSPQMLSDSEIEVSGTYYSGYKRKKGNFIRNQGRCFTKVYERSGHAYTHTCRHLAAPKM